MNAHWRDRAICIGASDAVFYPGKDGDRDRYAPARRVCAACPVIADCALAVLTFEAAWCADGRHGFCGGMDPAERARITSAGDAEKSRQERVDRIAAQRRIQRVRQNEVRRNKRAAERGAA